jgi:hypothetical protein
LPLASCNSFFVFCERVAHADLAVHVAAPGVEAGLPVVSDGQRDGVVGAARDLNHFEALELFDERGQVGVLESADAELTVVVAAPAVQVAFFICVERMFLAHKNVNGVLNIKRFNLESRFHFVAPFAHAANLGVVVRAPSVHLSLGGQRHSVIGATANLLQVLRPRRVRVPSLRANPGGHSSSHCAFDNALTFVLNGKRGIKSVSLLTR